MRLKPFYFLCLMMFISISTPAWSQYSNALEKISLQLKWTHQFQFAGYYAAKEQGYYADMGLDVEFIERTADTDIVKQVISGKAQYGISDSSLLLSFSKGTQIKALAAIFQHNPLVFISKKSSLITHPFEMKGKRIMFEEYGEYAPLRASLLGAGLKDGDYISVKHTHDFGALTRDDIDVISAYSSDAPFYYQQQGVDIDIINPQDYGIDFYGDILFTSTQEILDHSGRAKRFKLATLKGWQYALTHQEALVQLIHDKYNRKLSLDALRYEAKETAKLIAAATIPLGKIEESRLLRANDVYVQLGMTKPLSLKSINNFLYHDDVHRILLTPHEQAWLNEHQNLTFTGDPNWLPYEAFNAQGAYIGIVADHLNIIERHSGIKFTIVPTKTWQESIAKVRDGDIDVISETVDSSLIDKMVFTKPYLSSPIVIVMNDKQSYVYNIAQIADKKIAIIKGYGYIGHITDTYPELNIFWVDNLHQGLEAVSSGKVDALLSTLTHTTYAIAESAIHNVKIVGKTEFTNNLAFGVKKEYASVLIPILNRTFDSITESEKKQIFDKWGKVEFASHTNYRTVIQISLSLLLLLSIVLYWNRTLRLQIAARKQAETSLQISEHRFSSLLEAVDSISVQGYDANRNVIFWNKASEVLYGFTKQEALGKRLENLIIPDNMRSGLVKAHQDWLKSGIAIPSGELQLLHKNGTLIDVFSSHVLQTNIAGQLEMFCIDIDLSNRKLAEEALQKSEQSLRLSQEAGGVGTWEYDFITNESRCSSNVFQQLKFPWSTEKSSWDDVFSAIFPEDHAHVNEIINRHISEGSDLDFTYRITDTEGDVRWMRTIGKASFDSAGNPISMQGTIQDVTVQHLAEHDLRIAATAFESQEGMMVTDADKVLIRVNKAFTTITGYRADEAIGHNPSMLSSGRHDAIFYQEMWNIINTNDYWEGEVWNKRKNGDIYPEQLTITAVKDSNDKITNYVATLTDITLSKQAEQEIEDLAYYDPLTHLPNRRLMIDRIKHAMAASSRNGNEGALLFLDLDHFKDINDTLGHDIGDLLLQQVAVRLTSCIREGDTVSRFGGDEFVVLLEGLSSQSIEAATQVEDIANKILSSINQPYQLISHHYNSSASIGISLFNTHKSEVDELLKQADIALYQAKDDGRNTLRFFDPQMQANITARVELEKELKQAIEQSQFQLYYQIQLDDLLHATGAEVLIRWNHPQRGLVSPIDFIPIAEQTGTILAIGQWVLDSACAQLKVWQHNDATCDLTLSVNVSAKQFRQKSFTSQLMITLQQYAINPARLKLELTESLLLADIEDTIDKMKILAELGIQFSLDDFGTGYSSLQYLKRLPLYQLKIDKSFVDDLVSDSNDQAIVRTIIAMAHNLGLNVIAEGVETKEQQQCLLTEGCTHYQGYLFSKPVPLNEFEALLK